MLFQRETNAITITKRTSEIKDLLFENDQEKPIDPARFPVLPAGSYPSVSLIALMARLQTKDILQYDVVNGSPRMKP